MKNPSQGDLLRDAGIEATLLAESQDWKVAYAMHWQLFAISNPGAEIIAEDFRQFVEPLIGQPHHPNCWGAMWLGLCSGPWLEKTGKTRKMSVGSSHSRQSPVWRIYDKRSF